MNLKNFQQKVRKLSSQFTQNIILFIPNPISSANDVNISTFSPFVIRMKIAQSSAQQAAWCKL